MDEFYIVGVDPSLQSSGICILNNKGNIVHVESVVPQGFNDYSRLCYNYNRFKNIINSTMKIKYVAFEKQVDAQRYSYNASGILKLAENIGILKLAIYHSQVATENILEFTPIEIKKFATGNGKADKEMMMNAIGVRAMNHIKSEIPEHSINDVSDAYHCAKLGLHTILNKED